MSRVRMFVLLCAVAGAATAAVLLLTSGSAQKRTASTCPAGQRIVREDGQRDEGDRGGEGGDYESHFRGRCAPVSHPESPADLERFNEAAQNRQGSDTAEEFAQ